MDFTIFFQNLVINAQNFSCRGWLESHVNQTYGSCVCLFGICSIIQTTVYRPMDPACVYLAFALLFRLQYIDLWIVRVSNCSIIQTTVYRPMDRACVYLLYYLDYTVYRLVGGVVKFKDDLFESALIRKGALSQTVQNTGTV